MNAGFDVLKVFATKFPTAKPAFPRICSSAVLCLRDETVHTSEVLTLWTNIVRHLLLYVPRGYYFLVHFKKERVTDQVNTLPLEKEGQTNLLDFPQS